MEPLLKWPGGKRWLLSARPDLFDVPFDRYVEPFMGGGAAFFGLSPRRALLGDVNQELISVYKAIRDGWKSIQKRLAYHQERHSKDYYYAIRGQDPICRFERAARFIYLNRTCWNGLYRVNKAGKFNVPIGSKTNVLLPTDDFKSLSGLLKCAELHCMDFEKTIGMCGKGDLVFCDPPYVAQDCPGLFKKYHTSSFTWNDQVRLHESLQRAVSRGAMVVLLNAASRHLEKMYTADWQVSKIRARSTLAASSRFRGSRLELLAVSNPKAARRNSKNAATSIAVKSNALGG